MGAFGCLWEDLELRRITHLALGAAVTVPLVLDQPVPLALGCLAMGAMGGGAPDWIDFQSGVRKPFTPRHRGASHGLPAMVLSIGMLVVAVLLIRHRAPEWIGEYELVNGPWVWTVLTAFALGWVSHLASDACTISGIQPFLPFSTWRCWLLPKALRSRSDGYLDKIVRLAVFAILGFGIVIYALRWWQG